LKAARSTDVTSLANPPVTAPVTALATPLVTQECEAMIVHGHSSFHTLVVSIMGGLRLWRVGTATVLALLLGSPALAADTAIDRSLAGDAVCTKCHDQGEAKPVLSIYQTRHGHKADGRTPGCQSCHGASTEHVKNIANTDPRPPVTTSFARGTDAPAQTQTCLSCHSNGQRGHWAGSAHQTAAVPCASCHAVHVKQDRVMSKPLQSEVCFACHKSERAQTHRLSTHPLAAGNMACGDCHNPHGSTGPSLMRKASVNETCASCHADKRGPFLWDHQPVSESCTNCHTPHGSNTAPLLKARTPFLCQSCHSGDHAAQVNSGANLQAGAVTTAKGSLPLASAPARAQLAGRACQACHFQTHGSNHPAGAKLLR
jgi:DmsE family decaheme c-type cytochrome